MKLKALIFLVIMYFVVGFMLASVIFIGISQRDIESIKTQILNTQHAPGIVTIGDSTYIVRYYSLDY